MNKISIKDKSKLNIPSIAVIAVIVIAIVVSVVADFSFKREQA